jgi:ATP-binding cassette subfamily F protein 3
MSVLGLFMLGQGYFDREIATLSGGERSRLALALLFLRRCNFLVLDEPTNHLDLESRDALVEALSAFEGTLLVVAHDRHLLSEAVDEIWAVDEKGITVYEGGFSEYDAARRAANAASRQTAAPSAPASAEGQGRLPAGTGLSRDDLKKLKREQAEQRNALYKILKPLQARYEKQEAVLEEVLARHDEVEQLLADPAVYADGARAAELLKEFHGLQERSERELEALGELEAQIAELEAQRAALSLDGGE